MKKPKYIGLNRGMTYRYARPFHDFDYIDSLDDEAKAFLDKFCKEYYQNTFKRDGNDLQDDDKRRECYRNTNARQRDMWNQFLRLKGDGSYCTDPQDEDDK